jgi:hypothetical protein
MWTSRGFAVLLILIGTIIAITLGCVYGLPQTIVVTHTPAPPFITPTPPYNGGHGINIEDQPTSTLQIINGTSQNPLRVSLQLDPSHPSALWTKSSGLGTLGSAVFGDTTQNPPNYQIVSLGLDETIIVNLPDYTAPFRVTPLSDGVPVTEMPILMEGNKDLVFDMSAVDGVNYLLKMQLTASEGNDATIIDFNTSPCLTPHQGCKNPSINGDFKSGTGPSSAPCPFGTCNLVEPARSYSFFVNSGQCSNVDSTWSENGFSADCNTNPRSYTTYTYSHDDRNSSPTLVTPYKIKALYRDL